MAQFAAVCACLGIWSALPLGAETKWRLGAPIITYWAGPGSHTALDERSAAQLRAGGWNLGWTKRAEDLDLYHRHGMRVMLEINTPNVDDPAQARALDALIERVRNHPALYAYYLTDEPGAGAFPDAGQDRGLSASTRSRAPGLH